MFKTFEEALTYMEQNAVFQVDLKFVGPLGQWHHVSLPVAPELGSIAKRGVGFDGSSLGFKAVESGDMVLVPDPTSAWMDPFPSYSTMSFICDVREADTLADFPNDPRSVAKRAEQYLRDTKVADQVRFGPEFEFYVFDKVFFENKMGRSGYSVESAETDWNSPDGGHGHYIKPLRGYHAIPPQDCQWDLRTEITAHLQDVGIPVHYHHHEVGGPGQVEIEISLGSLTWASDATMSVKYIAKQTARKHGQTATFMPKPLHSEAGSGMHCHQTLWKGDTNLFFDPSGYAGLSSLARHYIAGLLHHGPALLALTNPSTNSYRRLIPGFEAPSKAFFSQANRSAAIRVPKYATTNETKRIEFRPPDATGNIYLVLAAQLMAGLDGILKKMDPTDMGFGPIDENVFRWSKEKQATVPSLPESLEEALDALERDHDFLLAGGVFTETLLDQWVRFKRGEAADILGRPHPYEVEIYFDV